MTDTQEAGEGQRRSASRTGVDAAGDDPHDLDRGRRAACRAGRAMRGYPAELAAASGALAGSSGGGMSSGHRVATTRLQAGRGAWTFSSWSHR